MLRLSLTVKLTILQHSGKSYKTFYARKLRQFSSQYDSRVVIYKSKMFIRLTTGLVIYDFKVFLRSAAT